MNKILSTSIVALFTSISFSQVQVPQLSPEAELEQVVGLTEIEVEYSRPSMRGRTIFGDLIPYGEMWRTGANKNSTISFSTPAKIGGVEVEAGEYALFTRPGKDSWKIFLYADTDNWGTPEKWDEEKVVAAFSAKVTSAKMLVETFTMQFDKLTTKSAHLTISWEKVMLQIPIEVPTDELTQASIKETMAGDSITQRDYYGAASYYLDAEIQLEKALEYIDKAIEIRGTDAYWYVRKKALIEHKLGKREDAIASAKLSLEKAKKAGNNSYVKMNEESIKAWESEK